MLTNEAISQIVKDSFPSHASSVEMTDHGEKIQITILGADGKPTIRPLRINAYVARHEPNLRGVIETMRFYVEDGGAFFRETEA